MIRHRVHRSHRVRKEDTCGDSLSATSGFCGKNTLRMPKAYPDIYVTLGFTNQMGLPSSWPAFPERPIENITPRHVTFHRVHDAAQISHASNLIFDDVLIMETGRTED